MEVRACYGPFVAHVERSQAPIPRVDEFFRYGMWFNAAAMGVEDLSSGGEWIRAELGTC